MGNGQNNSDNYVDPESVAAISGSDDLTDIVQVSSQHNHSCALTKDGAMRCWGEDNNGRLGTTTSSNAVRPLAVDNLQDVVQMSAGWKHTCALSAGGNVWCFGQGDDGKLGNGGTADSSTPVAVKSASSSHDLGAMVQISVGRNHTCALSIGGTVLCWGKGDKYQLGDGDTGSHDLPVFVDTSENIVQVGAGWNYTCGLTSGGKVLCWGDNQDGRTGNGNNSGEQTTPADYVLKGSNPWMGSPSLPLGTGMPVPC